MNEQKVEPKSTESSNPWLEKAVESIKVVFSFEEARYIFVAATLRYGAGFCIGVWKAPFIFEKFPGSENLFAGSNAIGTQYN